MVNDFLDSRNVTLELNPFKFCYHCSQWFSAQNTSLCALWLCLLLLLLLLLNVLWSSEQITNYTKCACETVYGPLRPLVEGNRNEIWKEWRKKNYYWKHYAKRKALEFEEYTEHVFTSSLLSQCGKLIIFHQTTEFRKCEQKTFWECCEVLFFMAQ